MGLKKHDWGQLELEWLTFEGSLKAFMISKNIKNEADFYRHAKKRNWASKKASVREQSTKKLQEKLATQISNQEIDRWKEHRQIFRAAKAQGYALIKKTLNDQGQVVEPMSASELKSLIEAFKSLAQAESFIDGGPSERVDNRNVNIHVQVLESLKERDDKYGVRNDSEHQEPIVEDPKPLPDSRQETEPPQAEV